jgi:Retron-type reverse transcriptase
LRSLDAIHRSLQRHTFEFRPSLALKYNFNGKRRTLYIPPWEERIVDLLLYRILNFNLDRWFSPNSYAYRERLFGLDRCQTSIARTLRSHSGSMYVLKRDISNFFPSIDHKLLIETVGALIDRDDYLFQLIEQRIRFFYREDDKIVRASVGVPFGCASACVLANIYLTQLDRTLEARAPNARFFRYADDILALSPTREAAIACEHTLEHTLKELGLESKGSHEANFVIGMPARDEERFEQVKEFRHLGLLFRTDGRVALSRDKSRKIQNLFRFAFRRRRRQWLPLRVPEQRARLLSAIAAEVMDNSVRNVAILDYYLKHVDDEEQLRMLDRWLAEEILSLSLGGHKKGHFRRIGFTDLRAMGLPSLVHRRRMIRNGKIDSPFFVWQREKSTRAFKGTAARLVRSAIAS